MIIFGTRRTVAQLALVVLTCANCHRSAAHALLKAVTKFTLFFVPLFAVRTRYGHQCTACGVLTWIDKAQAEQLRQAPPAPPAHPPFPVPGHQQPYQQPWAGPVAGNGTNGHTAPGPHPGALG